MNDDGTMNDLAFELAGMDRLKLVRQLVAKLEEIGALVKIENVSTALITSSGTCQVLWVEPRLSTSGS